MYSQMENDWDWSLPSGVTWSGSLLGWSGSAGTVWRSPVRFLSSHPEFPSRGVSLSRGYLVVLFSIWGLGCQMWSELFFFNAEYLPHPRRKSKTGWFWICPSSLEVCMSLLCSSDCCRNIIIQKCSVIVLYLFMVLAPWRLLVHTWEHLIMCPQKFGKTCLITIKGKWRM